MFNQFRKNKQAKWIFMGFSAIIVGIIAVAGVIFLFTKEYRVKYPSGGPEAVRTDDVITANNTFGFNLFKKLIDPAKNTVISPLSITQAFAMVYNGSAGETKKQMANVLQYTGIEDTKLNAESKKLINGLVNADKSVVFTNANSIWMKQGVEFSDSFLATNKEYYQAEAKSLDFSSPGAADIINKWVNSNTKGRIPTIITPPINPDMAMYLINAVYFKGSWQFTFDKDLTETKNFTTGKGKVLVPLMRQERKDFLYQENSDFQAVKLPYGTNERLNMIIIMPKTQLNDFIDKLNYSNWKEWNTAFSAREGILLLPRFKTEYKTKLNEPLINLGMAKAFSPAADFSRLISGGGVYINEALHKTFIEVNEEGTEAAAATSIGMVFTSMPNDIPPKFFMEVNKPFFFAITDDTTSAILFMGIISDPTK